MLLRIRSTARVLWSCRRHLAMDIWWPQNMQNQTCGQAHWGFPADRGPQKHWLWAKNHLSFLVLGMWHEVFEIELNPYEIPQKDVRRHFPWEQIQILLTVASNRKVPVRKGRPSPPTYISLLSGQSKVSNPLTIQGREQWGSFLSQRAGLGGSILAFNICELN